ncbi:MAG: DUF4097 domain-containing protein [Gemmatimonadaceae bacterium]
MIHSASPRIVFASLLAAAFAGVGAAGTLPAQERERATYRTRLDTTVSIARDGTVELSLVSGEIVVTGSDRRDVSISAYSEYGLLELDATQSRVTLNVRHHDERSRRGRFGDTHYDVRVPAGTRVEVHSVSGDVSVTGTRSMVEAGSVSGEVVVVDAAGRVSASSVSGDVRVDHVKGDIRGSTVSGELDVEEVSGDLELETVSGEISVRSAKAGFVRASSTSGEILYRGSIDAAGRYDFSSHSGDVRLEIPENTNAVVSVETFSGSLESDFPVRLERGVRTAGRPKRLEFTIGNAQGKTARISAETFSGSVVLSSGREDQ